ncbi:histone deacetylase interacting [Phlyctema vagabunda]|uniref:Histone deacetylase interacting n=1 Tax=Phlyctema vagabunda TaxID=108571 RepID=A0ABR4PJC7_9HELO
MNQNHPAPGSNYDPDYEDQHRLHSMRAQAEIMRHEREHNERQERERQERQLREHQPTPPHQNNAGSIPIHQPVASRLPGAIHSPGGLLANHGSASANGPLGAPGGPGNTFGGPLHNDRPLQHNPQSSAPQQQSHQLFGPAILNHSISQNPNLGVPGAPGPGFGGSVQQDAARLQQIPFGGPIPQTHQMPGAPGMGQAGQAGQQPILNDALSYLDQVKVQFADQPEVYNKFLDIMKDFKSQAIDTPGVINRVSDLFAGHPNLIQGFNTFLPPGYRIECGTGTDPNTIRVTTPMGTTVQSIPGRAVPDAAAGQGATGYYGNQRPPNWQQVPQHSIESPEAVFSPQAQVTGPPYSQSQPQQQNSFEAQQAAAAHQQQQRGVSQLTNAVAAVGQPPRNTQTPTPGGQPGANGAQPLEKRGPVEFNHAISYVNKIKNRFQSQPEIYKQFLEILQTYQRESKPIQDVYAQVTTLFNTAPDLLEDFKQFLPESAAAAKQAQAQKAAEEAALAASQISQAQRGETKMPPVGNFTVTGPKENKKRPRNNPPVVTGPQTGAIAESSIRGVVGSGAANKRTKLNHNRPIEADAPAVAPTLTPGVPEPLMATSSSGASSEELAFFDRVKKYIANKSTMNEFLKLCNLFSQDLIDRNVLVHKVSNFIGGNPDLMNWFKIFVNYEGHDEVIDNRPKPPSGRVALSNCRGLGPSYRLLPKRERLKPCSGRDEMCQAVLNDDWASHPTWASEDSGFVSHRKNIFEESLHRIEEERHDYDFNIEANAKVIQLLEPIAQTILAMDPHDREHFRMPVGLGGQSQAIYKRVLKKIYGDRGPEVAADLFKDPCAVLPVVLARLKQKDEEWRFTQREWEKVWHAQTQAMYLKSLDHMGIHVKQADKKNFAAKHLVDAIKTKHEEQRRQRATKGQTPRHQFSHDFADQEVVIDVLRFMILYATVAQQHNSAEKRRIIGFFEKFIQSFFDITPGVISARTEDIDRGTPDEEEDSVAELSNGRGRRPFNGRKPDLRRGVLDKPRNGVRARSQQDDSAAGSRESTPDVNSIIDDNMAEVNDDQAINEVTNERWATVPVATTFTGAENVELDLKADEPLKRDYYNLFCNQTVFVFFSIFQTLYRRLHEVKNAEADVMEEVHRSKMKKAAKDIGLLDDKNDYFGDNTGESYYARTLSLVEDFINGDVEELKYQDFLRHYYLKKGWQLYTVVDLLKTLCKLGSTCSSPDNKEKTPDLLSQFYLNRDLKETSYNTEINLRKQAEKYIKDGELFLIRWLPARKNATIAWMHKDETTFDLDEMERTAAWQYYTSSYVHIEPTEGIPRAHIRKSVLARNMPLGDLESEDGTSQRKPLLWGEDLTLQICVNTYKIIYKRPGQEWFMYADTLLSQPLGQGYKDKQGKAMEGRSQRFREKFEMNNMWMRDLTQPQVEKYKEDFNNWMEGGPRVVSGIATTTEAIEK